MEWIWNYKCTSQILPIVIGKEMTSNSCCLLLNFPFQVRSLTNYTSNNKNFPFLRLTNPSSLRLQPPPISAPQSKTTSAAMEADQSTTANTSTSTSSSGSCPPMNLLFVEMGVGYDQHGYVLRAHLAFSLLLC